MVDNRSSERAQHPQLAFVVSGHLVRRFFLLLQQGVWIRGSVGCSVSAFLKEEIGASSETIERIQSIMVDGKPVDDIGAVMVHDGSTLALSAAMPGLVGATLRRGGAYSSFRSTITYQEKEQACSIGEGWVNIKIFNLLMEELGPSLLRKGVRVDAWVLRGFLADSAGESLHGCSIALDGSFVDVARLMHGLDEGGPERVVLTVTSAGVS